MGSYKTSYAVRKLAILTNAGHGGKSPISGEYTTDPRDGKKWKHPVIDGQEFHGEGWLYEGVFNRQFLAEFIAQAQQAGFYCYNVMHPFNDTDLKPRTDLANHIKKTLGLDCIYLGIHSNAATGTARGFRNFYYPNSKGGKYLCECISHFVAPVCTAFGSPSPNPVRLGYIAGDPKRGIMHELSATTMIANLLEILFFDNIEDARLLVNPEFIKAVAAALVQAIIYYEQQVY